MIRGCTWRLLVGIACVYGCTGCTLRVELVPPSVGGAPGPDAAARQRLDDLMHCSPPEVGRCIDDREAEREAGG